MAETAVIAETESTPAARLPLTDVDVWNLADKHKVGWFAPHKDRGDQELCWAWNQQLIDFARAVEAGKGKAP